jgi:hypothetical protein
MLISIWLMVRALREPRYDGQSDDLAQSLGQTPEYLETSSLGTSRWRDTATGHAFPTRRSLGSSQIREPRAAWATEVPPAVARGHGRRACHGAVHLNGRVALARVSKDMLRC